MDVFYCPEPKTGYSKYQRTQGELKYGLLAAAAACLLTLQNATAGETDTEQEANVAPVHAETGFYAGVKAQLSLGEKVEHSENVDIQGHTGEGIGLEVGYKLGYGFAIEADGTYTHNTVTETNCETGTCEKTNADGEYMSVSLDLAYMYHLTHHLGTFVKMGYEYESEKISKLDVSGDDTGIIYAAGAEYAVGEHMALMAEYEGSTIESPLGSSVFAGVIYNF